MSFTTGYDDELTEVVQSSNYNTTNAGKGYRTPYDLGFSSRGVVKSLEADYAAEIRAKR